jgi:hypothetical protein
MALYPLPGPSMDIVMYQTIVCYCAHYPLVQAVPTI